MKGTINHGLVFNDQEEDFKLEAFSDSDWAGCVETRKSTSCNMCRLGNAIIAWKSKKQPIVALSSTEAEYIALCAETQEVLWLRRLLAGIDLLQKDPTTIFEDNQGAMALSKNPKNHSRTKHIDVKFHFVRESVNNGTIAVEYRPTAEMVADTLTKGLAKPKFEKFRNDRGFLNVTSIRTI